MKSSRFLALASLIPFIAFNASATPPESDKDFFELLKSCNQKRIKRRISDEHFQGNNPLIIHNQTVSVCENYLLIVEMFDKMLKKKKRSCTFSHLVNKGARENGHYGNYFFDTLIRNKRKIY